MSGVVNVCVVNVVQSKKIITIFLATFFLIYFFLLTFFCTFPRGRNLVYFPPFFCEEPMTTIFRPFSRKRGGKLIFRLGGGRRAQGGFYLRPNNWGSFNQDSLFLSPNIWTESLLLHYCGKSFCIRVETSYIRQHIG